MKAGESLRRLNRAAIVVTDSEDVFVARMQSGATIPSSSAKSSRFASRFSTIASMTTWHCLNAERSSAIRMRPTAAPPLPG